MKKLAFFIAAAALLGWASMASSGSLAYSALFYRPTGPVVYSLLGDGGVDDGGAADMSKPLDMARLPDLSAPPDMTPPIPPAQPPKNGRCLRIPYRPTSDEGRAPVDGTPVYWNHCGGYFCNFNTQVVPALCEPLKVQFYLGYKKSDCTGALTAIFPAQRDMSSYTQPPSGTSPPKFQTFYPPIAWFRLVSALPAEPVGTVFYYVVGGSCIRWREAGKLDAFYSATLTTSPPPGTEIYAGPTKWVP